MSCGPERDLNVGFCPSHLTPCQPAEVKVLILACQNVGSILWSLVGGSVEGLDVSMEGVERSAEYKLQTVLGWVGLGRVAEGLG